MNGRHTVILAIIHTLCALPVKSKFPFTVVKESPHLNSELTLVRRVKNYEEFNILIYFQTKSLVCQFPGCWKKT